LDTLLTVTALGVFAVDIRAYLGRGLPQVVSPSGGKMGGRTNISNEKNKNDLCAQQILKRGPINR
jgi:hypothetical protein